MLGHESIINPLRDFLDCLMIFVTGTRRIDKTKGHLRCVMGAFYKDYVCNLSGGWISLFAMCFSFRVLAVIAIDTLSFLMSLDDFSLQAIIHNNS